MRRSTRYTLLAVLLYLKQKAPPEVARLLPESDAMVYADLRPLRAATHFDRTPVQRSPSFQQFVVATGIVPERDLDRAAFALHRMPNPGGPNGAVAYSEIFEGRFDRTRLQSYLASNAQGTEQYAGRIIYLLPSENRTVRVAVIGYDMVAASNMPTPEQIHAILDRVRAAASPFSGSSLLEARYHDIPAFSSAWAIGRIGLPFTQNSDGRGQIQLFGLTLPLAADTSFAASLRYQGSVHLRVEEFAASEADAAKTAQVLQSLLKLVRTLQAAQPTQDPEVNALLDSIHVDNKADHAVVTATLPPEVLKRFASTQP